MSAPLVLDKVNIMNFGGYYGTTEARFPQGPRNVMLVQGKNTGGKTSFINAVKWCLYGIVDTRGEQPMRMVQMFNTVAANEGQATMRVTLDVKVRGEAHTIVREARRLYPNTPSRADSDYEVMFTVRRGNDVLSEDESLRVINRIAPRAISRFFLFDGELLKEYEELIQYRGRGNNSELVTAIEDVLGLPALKIASIGLDHAIKLANREQAQIASSSRETDNLSVRLKKINQEHEQLSAQVQDNENRIEQLEQDKAKLEREVEQEKGYEKTRGQIEQLKDTIERTKARIIEEELSLQLMTADAWQDIMHSVVSDRVDALDSQREALEDSYAGEVIDRHSLAQLQELLSTQHCGQCTQAVQQDVLDTIRQRVEELLENEQTRQAHQQAREELVYQVRAGRTLRDRLDPVYDRYQAAQTQLDSLVNEEIRLCDELDQKQAAVSNIDLEQVRLRRQRLEAITKELGVLDNANTKHGNRITEIEREQQSISDQLKAANVSQDALRAEAVRQRLLALKKVFDAGRDRLKEVMRQQVEAMTSTAYSQMIHEGDHEGVRIAPNTYELSIVDRKGRVVVEPSAGATQILALALIVALGKAGRPVGPIIMDTPFGRLDEQHRERVLNYMPRQTDQLVLLYHSGELQPSTQRTIQHKVGRFYSITKASEGRSMLREGGV